MKPIAISNFFFDFKLFPLTLLGLYAFSTVKIVLKSVTSNLFKIHWANFWLKLMYWLSALRFLLLAEGKIWLKNVTSSLFKIHPCLRQTFG